MEENEHKDNINIYKKDIHIEVMDKLVVDYKLRTEGNNNKGKTGKFQVVGTSSLSAYGFTRIISSKGRYAPLLVR